MPIATRHAASAASPFFFQAEDGIRDLTVTGVQTCALPIYCLLDGRRGRWRRPADDDAQGQPDPAPADFVFAADPIDARRGPRVAQHVVRRNVRSEERRVGKECSTMWSR